MSATTTLLLGALPRREVIKGHAYDLMSYEECRRRPLMRLLLPLYLLLDTIMMAVFTTAGKQWVVDKVQSVAPNSNALMDQIGWGTGSTAEAVGNTTLHIEDTGGSPAYARVTAVLSQPSADVDRAVGTITSNGTKTITESGRVQQATGGVMQQRSLFTGIPMLLNDRIEFTHDLQVT
jgi:hypothetical protein